MPKSTDWYDFWTGTTIKGGQTILADAPLDKIPLYIKAGSILPMGPVLQYSSEKPAEKLEIRIYEGSNGEFTLYDDEGDNYNYESGMYTTIHFSWNDAAKELIIGKINGSFSGMLTEIELNIILVAKDKGKGMEKIVKFDRTVKYNGKKLSIILK